MENFFRTNKRQQKQCIVSNYPLNNTAFFVEYSDSVSILSRRHSPECVMRSFVVIHLYPIFSNLLHLIQVTEGSPVWDVVSISAVKSFSINILVREAGLNIVNVNIVRFGPIYKSG